MKLITVLVITYNQENVIGRCLDSVLQQKEYGLKHIVVCDDCSRDGTWEILQKYAQDYPGIVLPHRNEHNLGIYPNLEKAVSLRGEADLYYKLSGDDALCDGWFQALQDYLDSRDIDFSIPFGIYSDWKSISPKKEERIFRQNIITSGLNPFSLYIRGKIYNRSLIINRALIEKFQPVPMDKGLNLSESAFDSQDHRFMERAYYLPFVGSVYYTGIGVSIGLNMNSSIYLVKQAIVKWDFFKDNYITDNKDKYYAKCWIEICKLYLRISPLALWKSMVYYSRSIITFQTKPVLKDYLSLLLPPLSILKKRL